MKFEEFSSEFSEGDKQDRLFEIFTLEKALNQLPNDQRAVVILNSCGFKQWEISQILGVSRITIWQKNKKALNFLRGYMSPGEQQLNEDT